MVFSKYLPYFTTARYIYTSFDMAEHYPVYFLIFSQAIQARKLLVPKSPGAILFLTTSFCAFSVNSFIEFSLYPGLHYCNGWYLWHQIFRTSFSLNMMFSFEMANLSTFEDCNVSQEQVWLSEQLIPKASKLSVQYLSCKIIWPVRVYDIKGYHIFCCTFEQGRTWYI